MKAVGFVLFAMVATCGFCAESDSLRIVAAELARGISKQGPVKVAVLNLGQVDDRISDGPAFVSEQLAGYLAMNKKISVVERHRLVSALEEMHMSETGLLDPQSVKSIGTMLGADVIVTGTLINLAHDKSEVNARAMFPANGRVIAASRALIDRTWNERRRLE